jgi:hypothetical protein
MRDNDGSASKAFLLNLYWVIHSPEVAYVPLLLSFTLELEPGAGTLLPNFSNRFNRTETEVAQRLVQIDVALPNMPN